MKKLLLLMISFVVLNCFSSCDNEKDNPNNYPKIKVDLNTMNYQSLMELLSSKNSLHNIEFVDGKEVFHVDELTASDITDPKQSKTLVFNSTADSLELMVSPAYATIRMLVDGQRLAYIAYADKVQQSEIVDFYNSTFPPADGEEPAVGSTNNGGFIRMDMSALEKQKQINENSMKAIPTVSHQGLGVTSSDLFNKIVSSFAPTQIQTPKTPFIDIYMLREKGANPIMHEIYWQVNDMIYSLHDVQNNVIFRISVLDTDYAGEAGLQATYTGFEKWVKASKYKDSEGIFYLCRWGTWNNYIGTCGGEYDVNGNKQVYGITGTSSMYRYFFAHLVGLNFGAKIIRNEVHDLMVENQSYVSWKHNNQANRKAIYDRLTYK
ncbi:MAG: hypothetical protein RR254_07785 [Muribaculaceae bacterium]